LVLVHAGVGMGDGVAIAFGADFSDAAEDRDFIGGFDVAHGIDCGGEIVEVRHGVALLEEFRGREIAGEGLVVGVGEFPGVIAADFGAGAVGLIGESEAEPEIADGIALEKVRENDIEIADGQDGVVAEILLLRGGESQEIGAIDLRGAASLLRLEDGDSAFFYVHQEDRAGVLEAGEIEEVVVFAVVGGFGDIVAGEKDGVSGLELFCQFGTAGGEGLRAAEIVDGLAVGVLRGGGEGAGEK